MNLNKLLPLILLGAVVFSPLSQAEETAEQKPAMEVVWKEDLNKYRDMMASNEPRGSFQKRVQASFNEYFDEFYQKHFEGKARLKVELVEIDMAGTVRYSGGKQARVMRDVDFPVITFKFEIADDKGNILASGEELMKDMNYLRSSKSRRYKNDSFQHEKILIEDFFTDVLVPAYQKTL